MSSADEFGAFLAGPRCRVEATSSGPLDGLRFAVKDVMDVAGQVTGCGNPHWAAAQPPAPRHAHAVAQMLGAGAALDGKTITDELAFSLEGDNWHHGTPRNPRCPDCLPGGSSSGSAVAVAAGLVDVALGTDTGGSVRVPAAFCGVFGMRPSHGAIALHGVLPFAPDYDTVGWFARSATLLGQVGQVLLPDAPIGSTSPRLLLVADAFALAEPVLAAHLLRAAHQLGVAGSTDVFGGQPQQWLHCYHTLQGAQIRHTLGPWLARARPVLGPAIAARFAGVAGIDDASVIRQQARRERYREQLLRLLSPGTVLVMPSTPCTALPLTSGADARGPFYAAALAINAIAGHAGLPQITIPFGAVGGKPAGLSFVAAPGADRWLLQHAQAWAGHAEFPSPTIEDAR